MFPPEAVGATQNINAVPPIHDGGRPMFRDEVPDDAGAETAQFEAPGVNDFDDYDGGYEDYEDGARDTGAKKRRILLIAGFAVLLLVAGGSAFFLASGLGSGDSSTSATVTDEADDPGALDPEALFPESVEIDGQGAFTRVAVEDTEDCATGTHGDYGQVLTDNQCRQMVRASYLSEDESQAVTIGVAAMPTDEEAGTALEAQDLVAAQWFAGLSGEEGTPAERLGHTGGYGSSSQWGRYLLFSLATHSDGTEEEGEDTESATELRTVGEGFLDQAHTQLSDDRG